MLKPVEPTQAPERPIGELVHELVEEGKAYARAEVGLARIIAVAKAKALALPLALFAAALLIMLAALNAFAVGLVMAFAKFIGPLAAGFAGMLILAAVAGGLIWFGIERARQAL
jgi:uncharacterized integral membrane protein